MKDVMIKVTIMPANSLLSGSAPAFGEQEA